MNKYVTGNDCFCVGRLSLPCVTLYETVQRTRKRNKQKDKDGKRTWYGEPRHSLSVFLGGGGFLTFFSRHAQQELM